MVLIPFVYLMAGTGFLVMKTLQGIMFLNQLQVIWFPKHDFSRADTSEFFDGEVFTPAPELPEGTYFHCTAEVEPGQVVVVGGGNSKLRAYIIDVDTGDFTDLPSLPTSMYGAACGVVPAANGGKDIVVLGGSYVYIYYNALGAWHPGPPLPVDQISYPAYLPYGDSFIVFGGNSAGGLDDVFLYNYVEKEWDKIAEMEVGRAFFGYAYVSKDSVPCL